VRCQEEEEKVKTKTEWQVKGEAKVWRLLPTLPRRKELMLPKTHLEQVHQVLLLALAGPWALKLLPWCCRRKQSTCFARKIVVVAKAVDVADDCKATTKAKDNR